MVTDFAPPPYQHPSRQGEADACYCATGHPSHQDSQCAKSIVFAVRTCEGGIGAKPKTAPESGEGAQRGPYEATAQHDNGDNGLSLPACWGEDEFKQVRLHFFRIFDDAERMGCWLQLKPGGSFLF